MGLQKWIQPWLEKPLNNVMLPPRLRSRKKYDSSIPSGHTSLSITQPQQTAPISTEINNTTIIKEESNAIGKLQENQSTKRKAKTTEKMLECQFMKLQECHFKKHQKTTVSQPHCLALTSQPHLLTYT
eukprot:7943329-Ditylum_brightwellii.AAC.1